jgi:hypothetical protein
MASRNIWKKQGELSDVDVPALKSDRNGEDENQHISGDLLGDNKSQKTNLGPQEKSQSSEAQLNEQITIGNELAVRFKEQGVHPVLIFGSQMSGKTSLLLSLINYPRTNQSAEASIEYDSSLYTQENEERLRSALDSGQALFYRAGQQWIANSAPKATLDEHPFFIPVVLQRLNGQESKFAFLEGRGEWYTPDEESLRPYRKFKGLIQGFLQTYSDPITVLYVAPFVPGSYGDASNAVGSSELLRKADLGLVGAMEEYISGRRGYFRNDFHILTLTKWDIKCGGVTGDAFLSPLQEEISEELSTKFPLTWNRFSAIPMENQQGNLRVNAYSAGIMDGNRLNQLPEDDRQALNRYPRKLWDRLHVNAGQGILYKDVQHRPPSFAERLIAWLRG